MWMPGLKRSLWSELGDSRSGGGDDYENAGLVGLVPSSYPCRRGFTSLDFEAVGGISGPDSVWNGAED